EYTLVAIADYILGHKKGPTVSNLSSTLALRDISRKHGVEYHAAAVGEVNVVNKMKEVSAVIGGEGNGGVIVPELHYGRDALVGIALMLTHMAEQGKTLLEIKSELPYYEMTKSKIDLTKETDVDGILRFVENKFKDEDVTTIDGVKIIFDSEWVHLRKSNTEPIIRIYAESSTKEKADKLVGMIRSTIESM
ncbi:phosphoglucosamine mutase, partial [Saprospiraceae bacterium]|nr:phosphoglucosamine mutase [Saprospiraceae bacterium]